VVRSVARVVQLGMSARPGSGTRVFGYAGDGCSRAAVPHAVVPQNPPWRGRRTAQKWLAPLRNGPSLMKRTLAMVDRCRSGWTGGGSRESRDGRSEPFVRQPMIMVAVRTFVMRI